MEVIKKIGPLILIGLTALAFAVSGFGKLSGSQMMHMPFAKLGLPEWFGYFIGTCEIAGAIALWFRRLSALAAAGLAIIMIGAVYFHIMYALSTIGPALILLILSILIFTWRRADLSLRAQAAAIMRIGRR
jgi:putative oxidoreductase